MNNKKFQNFLESLKSNEQDTLIETIQYAYNAIFENEQSELFNQLNALKPKLAEAAQSIYNEWDATSDPDNGDPEVGFGGICHIIADKMADALSNNPNMWAVTNSTEFAGSPHVNILVFNKDNTEGYVVDIVPFTYETGGGYQWNKIPDVEINPSDVSVYPIDPKDFLNENGDLIEY